jgi:hypothetical protein
MVKLKMGFIASCVFSLAFLVGCGDDKPAAPDTAATEQTETVDSAAAPEAAAPVAPAPTAVATGTSSSAKPSKAASPHAADHPYDVKSRMVFTVGEKEISAFSLTATKVTDKDVRIAAGIVAATDTPLAKDSLVIIIDDEPVKFSPGADDPYVFDVDIATINKMLAAKKVVIDLYVEENKYFEGDFLINAKDTFKQQLTETLKK